MIKRPFTSIFDRIGLLIMARGAAGRVMLVASLALLAACNDAGGGHGSQVCGITVDTGQKGLAPRHLTPPTTSERAAAPPAGQQLPSASRTQGPTELWQVVSHCSGPGVQVRVTGIHDTETTNVARARGGLVAIALAVANADVGQGEIFAYLHGKLVGVGQL